MARIYLVCYIYLKFCSQLCVQATQMHPISNCNLDLAGLVLSSMSEVHITFYIAILVHPFHFIFIFHIGIYVNRRVVTFKPKIARIAKFTGV